MFILEYEDSFDAAHFLPGHDGKCANLHGHTWRVKICIESSYLGDNGMVIDFGRLKEIIQLFDHANLNEKIIANPTAENIANMISGYVLTALAECGAPSSVVKYVDVWESEHSKIRVS